MTGLARLGRDAALRYLPDGTPVLNLALAFNHGQKDRDGNRQTQWLDAALFGKRGESLAPHLLKGAQVCITIEDPHNETWRDNDGVTRIKMAGRVLALDFAARPPAASVPSAAPSGAPPGSAAEQAPQGDFDDDIQF